MKDRYRVRKMDSSSKKRLVLTGAEKMFVASGLSSVTVINITKDLKIAQKVIYANFADKEAIVFELMKRRLIKEEAAVSLALGNAKNHIEEIVIILTGYFKMVKQIFPFVEQGVCKLYPNAWKEILPFRDGLTIPVLNRALLQAIEQTLVRHNINTSSVKYLLTRLTESGYYAINECERDNQPVITQHQVIEILMYGISTLKGINQFNEMVRNVQQKE